MRDGSEPVPDSEPDVMPPSHGRILAIMAVLGVSGSIAAIAFGNIRFGAGILFGTALAFGNYYWLRASLRRVFAEAADGKRPKISAIRYLSRYLAIGVVVAVVFVTDIIPIVAVLLGLAGFGFATVVEGFIRIFSGLMGSPEE
jgi:hypothetical protein